VVEVKNVNKSFRIHHEKKDSLYEYLFSIFNGKNKSEEIEVLNDISFSVKKGEMVGIIGLNGSGKTTLLRIIAGIYQPDSGNVIKKGNTIPFLELGSGFQAELTAKENVLLYGLILGFTKKQIQDKIESILKFAELEKFADVRIKNFSSGMFARLAFSTAVQVNPDILVIDEVLAVGDLPFQQKSFDTFMSFRKQGKSIILVSHNLDTVEKLCDKVIFIHKGRIHSIGKPSVVVNSYRKVVDNITNLNNLREESSKNLSLQKETDEDVFRLRPWYQDFTKLGINNGKDGLIIPQAKNQYLMEPIILSFIKTAFSEFQNKKPSVLDMFCYDGYYSLYIQKNYDCSRFVAMHDEQEHIERAKLIAQKLKIQDIEIKLQDVHAIKENERFDIVLNLNALHMLSDPENMLKLTYKLTKKFAIIQSIFSLESNDENYFQSPAPHWTWGCRFSEKKIVKWLNEMEWDIVASKKTILEYNPDPWDRGCIIFLCEKK